MSNKLTIAMYHYVRHLKNSRFPNIKGLEVKDFEKQLEFFSGNYRIISSKQLRDAVKYGESLPEKALLLTFDDGYTDHYTNVFPLLANKGLTGVFGMPGKVLKEQKVLDVNKIHFILASEKPEKILGRLFKLLDLYRGSEFDYDDNDSLYERLALANRFDAKETVFIKRVLQTELPERCRNIITGELFKEYIADNEKAFCNELYMSMEQIKIMKKSGMEFAHHGYAHYRLGNLNNTEMEADINKGLEVFDGIIDQTEWIMCYPYGSCNDNVKSYIKTEGCYMGLGTSVAASDLSTCDIYELPRMDTNDFPPKSENYKNIK